MKNDNDNKLPSDHVRSLRQLGFPEGVVQESESARKAGLFDLKPSADLVERTVKALDGTVKPPSP